MDRKHSVILLMLFIFFPAAALSGCAAESSEKIQAQAADTKRSNTPVVYTPEAPMNEVIGQSPLIVDISNTSQGYVMAKYNGHAAKANIQITGPDGITYKYFLTPSEHFITLPLTGGSGTYGFACYENVVDNKYAVLFKKEIIVSLENEFLPYLYPNQYVNFNKDSRAVSLASEITAGAASDLEAVAAVYHYVIENIIYDDEKAEKVTSGYLPDIDDTLATKSGICFDYASLTTAMLRSQDIPTRLEIGYSGEIYHSWISVYIEDVGWIDNMIEFTGDSWTRMDPTFAAGNENSEKILKYIGDGTNYTLQYTR